MLVMDVEEDDRFYPIMPSSFFIYLAFVVVPINRSLLQRRKRQGGARGFLMLSSAFLSVHLLRFIVCFNFSIDKEDDECQATSIVLTFIPPSVLLSQDCFLNVLGTFLMFAQSLIVGHIYPYLGSVF